MKNPFKPQRIPLLILFGGMLGFLLRLWLFVTGVDNKGLIRADHPAGSLVFVLTAAVLLGLYLCLRPLTGTPTYRRHFKHSALSAVGCWIGAAGILATNIYEMVLVKNNISTLSFILGVIAAAALVLLGICRLRGARPKTYLHGCVTIYLMIHLISQYRDWSAEPQLQVY